MEYKDKYKKYKKKYVNLRNLNNRFSQIDIEEIKERLKKVYILHNIVTSIF